MRIEENFARQEALFNSKFQVGNAGQTGNTNDAANASKVGFKDVLTKCIDDTNSKLVEADSTASAFVKGEDVSIDDVMIKNEEASLCLQFLTQTRDKLLDGYDTLSKLQL